MGATSFLLFCCLGFLSGLNMEDFQQPPTDKLRWNKNPFVLSMDAVNIQDLALMAIVYHPDDASCLINGKVLRQGESIGGAKLVYIQHKHVILRNESGLFRLTLP